MSRFADTPRQLLDEIERLTRLNDALIDGHLRNATIEECAVVVETFPKDFWGYTQDEVAAAIRALKDKP